MNPFASKQESIFRQAALDRLSSPEQIDQLDVLIPRRSWVILLGFMLFIGVALYWGVYGSIPTRVDGRGILLTQGGVVNVLSPGAGSLVTLKAKPESVVNKGDIVAEIEQPELRKEIEAARQRVDEAKERLRLTRSLQETEQSTRKALNEKRRTAILDSVKALNAQKAWLDERVGQQEQLQEKGLITKQAVIESKREVQRLESQIRDSENQLKQLPVEEVEADNNRARELLRQESEIAEGVRNLELLEKRREVTTAVVAPETGRVLEVMAAIGDLVSVAQPLLSLEPQRTGPAVLEGIFYVPLKDGKLVKPDMTVQITPGTVKREEYGFIKGKVISISPFAATSQGMQAVLGNQTLVKSLMEAGAPLAVRARLEVDPRAPSGYQWSSGDGPDLTLTSGTFCDAAIVVRQQAPLTLLIPTFKEYTGL